MLFLPYKISVCFNCSIRKMFNDFYTVKEALQTS